VKLPPENGGGFISGLSGPVLFTAFVTPGVDETKDESRCHNAEDVEEGDILGDFLGFHLP